MQRSEIVSQINQSLHELVSNLMVRTGLINRMPGLCSQIMEYTLRDGKRIRSTLLALSYLGQAEEPCRYLFRGAASMELFHLFALIQDDTIDNSDLRRGKLSLHKLIEKTIKGISLRDAVNLSIVYSDILYSAAIEAFLEIDTASQRKVNALKSIIDAAVSTGNGQFLELVYSTQSPEHLSLDDIYTIYDLKTSRYTFCGPLLAGAQLAGACEPILTALYQAGLYLGRAYQIVDDLQEFFSIKNSSQIPPDIAERRKTILMWHLYHNGNSDIKDFIENLNHNSTPAKVEQKLMPMFEKTGTFNFAITEKNRLCAMALKIFSQDIFLDCPELVKVMIEDIYGISQLIREHVQVHSHNAF